MRVRIGITDSREIDCDVKSEKAFKGEVEAAFSGDSSRVLWVIDTKSRSVGIPVDKIAFVEMESSEDRPSVGFSAE